MKQTHNVADAAIDGGDVLERLFELGVRLADSMDQGLAARGLTRSRAGLMWRLRRLGPQTQRSLSQLLECTPRNVTGLVDALEASGYVARSPHPTDRRATIVSLTAKGTDATRRMEREYRSAAGELFARIDPIELKAFSTTLDKILPKLLPAPADADRSA